MKGVIRLGLVLPILNLFDLMLVKFMLFERLMFVESLVLVMVPLVVITGLVLALKCLVF
jgi:hypothetical protein